MDLHTTDRDTRRFGAWITFFFLHELTAADGASHSEYGDQYRIVSLLLLTLSLTLTRNSTTAIPFSLLILTTNNHFPGFRWTREFSVPWFSLSTDTFQPSNWHSRTRKERKRKEINLINFRTVHGSSLHNQKKKIKIAVCSACSPITASHLADVQYPRRSE